MKLIPSKKVIFAIPVYNEAKTLKSQIIKLQNFIKKNIPSRFDITILIASNGSTDSTIKVAQELRNTYDNVEILNLESKGFGLAIKESFLFKDSEYFGYFDLDFSTPLEYINTSLEKLENQKCSVINGTRLHKESIVQNRSIIRASTSRIFNWIIKIIFKTKFTDGMCGFKFFNTKDVEKLFQNNLISSDKWFFSTEILILCELNNILIEELPLAWTNDKNSKVKILQLSREYLLEILNLKKRLKNDQN